MSENDTSEPSGRESFLAIVTDLRKEYGENAIKLSEANEASTRLLIIDRVLESLEWPQDEFNPEHAVGRQSYLDYLLKIDGVPRLIVEAKRVNNTFGPPSRKSTKTNYTIRYLKTAFGPAFTEVLKQAERYALENQVPYAVVTNGAEWVLLQLSRVPGHADVADLSGLYFGNIFTDNSNLELMWELLYRPHVQDGSLEAEFAQLNTKEADYSRTPQTQLGDLQWQTPSGNAYLHDFYYLFFDEIVDQGRRNMLEKCFVTNSKLDHYQGELQRTLRDTAPPYIGDAVEISPEERGKIIGPRSGDQKGRVVLVTGSVGCGKTTLVHKVLVEARQGDQLIALVIDLINEIANEDSDVSDRLWKYVEKAWRNAEKDKDLKSHDYDQLKKIFGAEISQLKSGPRAKLFEENQEEYQNREAELLEDLSNDPEQFLPKCWRYYRQKNRGIVVFFDNVDRASQPFQEKAYAFAHKLAQETGATVIITMREFTFFRGKEAGFLDVRSSDSVFHLQAPNILQVLSKRVRYVEEHLQDDHRLSDWKKREDWEDFRKMILEDAGSLKRTFLVNKEGDDKLSILEAIAWHNIRLFLLTLRQLHSLLGNTGGSWELPEMIAALMIPSKSGTYMPVISSIYKPPLPNFQCYFLKLRLLLLLAYAQPNYQMRRGASLDRLMTIMSLYGYRTRWTKQSVTELVRQRYLECLEAPSEEDYTKHYEVSPKHSYRPSPMAMVMIEHIASKPIYLGLIGNSLPFHNPAVINSYEETLKEVYEAVGQQMLEPEAVDLLSVSGLSEIVARYLVRMYEEELPPSNLLNYVPEIASTEDKLTKIIEDLKAYINKELPAKHPEPTNKQLMLFPDMDDSTSAHEYGTIRIPHNIESIRVGRSEMAPLVFCALVILNLNGQKFASGVEIAEVINQQIVDDNRKKAPNNVSRALRSDVLKSQPWLTIRGTVSHRKRFGLSKGWEKYWVDMFEEDAPQQQLGIDD